LFSDTNDMKVVELTDKLRVLETERDEAVKTGTEDV
jgi:hypothetical protein